MTRKDAVTIIRRLRKEQCEHLELYARYLTQVVALRKHDPLDQLEMVTRAMHLNWGRFEGVKIAISTIQNMTPKNPRHAHTILGQGTSTRYLSI